MKWKLYMYMLYVIHIIRYINFSDPGFDGCSFGLLQSLLSSILPCYITQSIRGLSGVTREGPFAVRPLDILSCSRPRWIATAEK